MTWVAPSPWKPRAPLPRSPVGHGDRPADGFGPPGFGRALHAAAPEIAAAEPAACTTPVRGKQETTAGPDIEGHAAVHVVPAPDPAAPPAIRGPAHHGRRETDGRYVKPADGLAPHLSAGVRDLDGSYRGSEG